MMAAYCLCVTSPLLCQLALLLRARIMFTELLPSSMLIIYAGMKHNLKPKAVISCWPIVTVFSGFHDGGQEKTDELADKQPSLVPLQPEVPHGPSWY
jgi:hypothetical protein